AQRLRQDGGEAARVADLAAGDDQAHAVRHRTKSPGRRTDRRRCPRVVASLRIVGRGAALIAMVIALALPGVAAAAGPLGPLPAPNDLLAIGEGAGQEPYTVATQ